MSVLRHFRAVDRHASVILQDVPAVSAVVLRALPVLQAPRVQSAVQVRRSVVDHCAAADLDPTEDDRIFDGALNDAAIGDHRIFSLGVDAVFDRHLVTDKRGAEFVSTPILPDIIYKN